jgi:hypothetical protein
VKVQIVSPEYVEQLPEQLEEGVLYICEEFDLTAHKCCCGCGEDVYNKLSPAKWRLVKMPDGSVSLDPSVGNWKYSCQSHYWIRNNRVIDAGPMSARAIQVVQQRDLRDRDRYIAHVNAQADQANEQSMNLWERTRALFARTLRRLKALWPW